MIRGAEKEDFIVKQYKIGVFGAGRGVDIAKNFRLLDCEIVALCDDDEKRLEYGLKRLGDVPTYRDFDEFLDCGMDAVILANSFHEHAPYAIKCFQKGIHVFGECISNGTMAEGVALTRAYRNSKSIYFLAENYPQMNFNLEMQRICRGGTLGKILYAEGEYNHPSNPNDTAFRKDYNYHLKHWRNYLPKTYYITHSLGPLMRATGATPKTVTAFASFAPPEADAATASHVGDRAAIITTQNDDGSIFRVTGCANFGGEHIAYRFCGTEGQVESRRGLYKILLRYNEWSKPEGMEAITSYHAKYEDKDLEKVKKSGHGGSDYLTARMFLECLEENRQPEHPFDLKSAIAMSSVAILGHRSVLNGGKPYAIPDFDREADCALYENDHLSPFYGSDGTAPTIPCCSHPDYAPTQSQVEKYLQSLEE